MKPPPSLAYDEVTDHLQVRIQAHTLYANFTLETWFAENLTLPQGGTLLEVGCGDGNWFSTWATALGPEGTIVGIDKNSDLLEKAARRTISCHTDLKMMDFNDLSALATESFDAIIAPFSIYYADDAQQTMAELHRLARPGAHVTMVGPTARNALELYQLNALVFGHEKDERTQARAARIETEFFDVARPLFADVSLRLVPRCITFPSVEHYLTYFQSTLLFRESVRETGHRPTPEELTQAGWKGRVLSKEVIVVEAVK